MFMKSRIAKALSLIILSASLLGVAFIGTAQVKQGKTRAMKTSQFMKGVVKPSCGAIKKGLDAGPADDDAWEEVAMHAAILNEASYNLMEDGRCPDGVWAGAVNKKLREGSGQILAAADEKNLEQAKAGFQLMTQSCKACHDAHKKKE
jgi:cytochrome c556